MRRLILLAALVFVACTAQGWPDDCPPTPGDSLGSQVCQPPEDDEAEDEFVPAPPEPPVWRIALPVVVR